MYPLDLTLLRGLRDGRWTGVGANVLVLGMTSLLTDVSSEMVAAVLPLYLATVVGLSPLQFGVVDGLAQLVVAAARLASGWVTDRSWRHRDVAAAGYGLSAACRLLLAAAGTAVAPIIAAVMVDRVGKGIRTAPRDALLSLSAPPGRLGLAFGVHRALDTCGALLGPVIAFAILAAVPLGYDLVFVTSFGVAVCGLALLLCFARNVPSPAPSHRRVGLREARALWADPRLRRLLGTGAGLGLLTVGDAFLFLVVQSNLALPATGFPLLFVGSAAVYLVLAIPVGRLSDRIGRRRVFLGGHALLAAGGAVLAAGASHPAAAALAVGLLGACYACTDGVLMAAAGRLLPPDARATGMAVLATAGGIARLVAAVGFGALWTTWGDRPALALFSAGLALAVLVLGWFGREESW